MSVCWGRLATIMATSASVMAIARVVGVGPGGPANGAVLDDEGSHAAGVGDDLVVLSGVCRVAEDGREPFGADVDAAVHPVHWVHRSVNVGPERFATVFCYAADAGQDYQIISDAGGMRTLVVKDGAVGWTTRPNPDHTGYRHD